MERYTIIYNNEVFYDKYFTAENCFAEGMIVIDNAKGVYTTDGKTWLEIEFNHP